MGKKNLSKLVPIPFPSPEQVTIEIGSAVTKINDGVCSNRVVERRTEELISVLFPLTPVLFVRAPGLVRW